MRSIRYYFDHWRISLLALTITALCLALGSGLTSFQSSAKAASTQTPRTLNVSSLDGSAATVGQDTRVAIRLASQGDENTIAFSLNFNAAVFSFSAALPGDALPTGTVINPQPGNGQLGISITLPPGASLGDGVPGLREIVRITFKTISTPQTGGTSSVTFGNNPQPLAVADVNGGPLTTMFNAPIVINVSNPAPQLTSVNPTSATAGGPIFDISVTGLNFVNSSAVRFNGFPCTTTFVSPTRLNAKVPAAAIASPGSVPVTVFTPSPGGGTSNPIFFTINSGSPSITSVNPNSVGAGSPDLPITVTGSSFVSGSKVLFDSLELTTSFVSVTQLTATIPASSLTTAGTSSITVSNPAPGGGISNAVTFTIIQPAPVPSIAGLSPAFAVAGSPQFTLTVNGSGFVSGSTVRWNGSARQTTVVSGSQLTAIIPATDIASPGTASVTVFNPSPGGGTSNAASFFVGAQLITSASAASFRSDELAEASLAAGFSVNLTTGSGVGTDTNPSMPGIQLPTFLAGRRLSVVDSLGVERDAPLFFVSAAQINYQIPQGMVDGLGTVVVRDTQSNGSGDNIIAVGALQVTRVAPGIFAANTSGQGVPAAYIVRVKPGGAQINETILRFDAGSNSFVTIPYDMGDANDLYFLILFGTGFRNRASLGTVSATIGGIPVSVEFAAPQPLNVALDQANIRLKRELIGRADVDVVLMVDGKPANVVKLSFKQ